MLDILLIDDDPELADVLYEALQGEGHAVRTAVDGGQALDLVRGHVFDVLVCDVRLPTLDGLSLMRRTLQESPRTAFIVMTAHANVADAVAALKEGAYDYLTKPFDLDELLTRLRRIEEHRTLEIEVGRTRAQLLGQWSSDATLLGESPGIRRALETIRMVAPSDAPVLISGESGTGKELAARMVHDASSRRDKPLITVNCCALAENLIEAELFGHERGAFTGALKQRDGRFKAADGGTLFLDEVAELPLPAQVKLLRVLQEGTFEPLGADTSVKVDVRLISATHRDLDARTKTGEFREDLFYRINAIEIPLPPLRDRPTDLPLLIRHFLTKGASADTDVPRITPRAWAALSQHAFPGNVRELGHAIEHARILARGGELDLRHLPKSISGLTSEDQDGEPPSMVPPEVVRPLMVVLREFELQYLRRAVDLADGKRTLAAEWLGISRKTLWQKLRQPATSQVPIVVTEDETSPPALATTSAGTSKGRVSRPIPGRSFGQGGASSRGQA